tara:strand:- start:181 stop:294 length:114 start_codon:yes stop_codon:yes gene_type:complete
MIIEARNIGVLSNKIIVYPMIPKRELKLTDEKGKLYI